MSKLFLPSSHYQKNIYKFVAVGKGNAIINAVAGSGKTTTILNSLKYIPRRKSVVFCAFNSHIVKELKSRAPLNVDVTTMHSLGWAAMRKYYQGIKMNPYKTFDTCDRLLWHIPKWERFGYFYTIQKLVDLYRQNLATTEKEMMDLAIRHNIEFYDDEMIDAFKVFNIMIENTAEFDFTDMIYVAVMNDKVVLPKYDYIFVDECQDLTVGQQVLLGKMMKPNTRVIAVGDRNQAIYGFMGADVQSFKKLSKLYKMKPLPLSICYRCSSEVIERAKKIVPQIEAREGAEKGSVRDGQIEEVKDGDWVLCRNNKPLVMLCIQMIKDGKKAHIKGNDIGKSIINLLKKLKENNVTIAMDKLNHKVEQMKQKLLAFGLSSPDTATKVVDLKEKVDIVKFLAKDSRSVKKIIESLEKIFNDSEKGGIMLSSIHKAKGLENDRVFLLLPELMPSKYATQPWMLEQEHNLEYVATTRAKRELIYIRKLDIQS